MKINLAINGYGRIGRCIVRALYESAAYSEQLRVVAINELADLETMAHLTRYDSTHGRFRQPIDVKDGGLVIGGDRIAVYKEKNPLLLPWQPLGVDVVLECTGSYTDRKTAGLHLAAGAKNLIFSQPADDVDATIVYGVNHQELCPEHTIISNASCTTNCIIPVIQILDRELGIIKGNTTTIHSAMHDQPVIDAYNRDLRKTRSAMQSIIPVSTELNRGIGRIMPSLDGRFESLAIRVPTANVSLMDLNVMVEKSTNVERVNRLLKRASEKSLQGVLGFSDEELVSCDFNHDSRSGIVDGNQTRVSGTRLVKVLAWFDNEWGFSNRMLDTSLALMAVKGHGAAPDGA
ncbi:MAG: glyceraldehyde 3-phosphate dehydrogenase NAD-binding domain-containing protein [bacterium]